MTSCIRECVWSNIDRGHVLNGSIRKTLRLTGRDAFNLRSMIKFLYHFTEGIVFRLSDTDELTMTYQLLLCRLSYQTGIRKDNKFSECH
jgi:hypothetical protein